MTAVSAWPAAVRTLSPVASRRLGGVRVREFALPGAIRLFLAPTAPAADGERHWLAKDVMHKILAEPETRVFRSREGGLVASGGAQVALSLTRAEGYTLFGLARNIGLGIDMETHARVAASASVEDRWLSARERRACEAAADPTAALACSWTLKEALGKALGIGMPRDPAAWSFVVDGRITFAGSRHARAGAEFGLWRYRGFLIATALIG